MMNPSELDELLDKHFPDLTDRAKAREFSLLASDAREIYLFAAVEDVIERLGKGHKRMTSIERCIATLHAKNSPKAHVAQFLYTTGAIAAAIVAVVTGGKWPSMFGGF